MFHEHIFQGLLILHDRYKKILLSFYKVNLGIFKGRSGQENGNRERNTEQMGEKEKELQKKKKSVKVMERRKENGKSENYKKKSDKKLLQTETKHMLR